mgnify:CR=1 FL=1|jgi:hypothetical protein
MEIPKYTRFLYEVKDVKASLLVCLLKKDTENTIFWVNELYLFDKNECWNYIYEIYFNFYGYYTPKGERLINDLYSQQYDLIDAIFIICRNMIDWTADPRIFLIYQAYKQVYPISSTYKGAIKTWMKDYDIKYRNLLRSLDKQNFYNLAYYLSCLTYNSTNVEDIFNLLCKYYSTQKGYNVNCTDAFNHIVNDCFYENKLHIVISVFLYLTIEETEINTCKIEREKQFDELGIFKLIDDFKGIKVNNILEEKRIPIELDVNYFKRTIIDSNEWTQYIGNCEWWNKKIKKYNGEYTIKGVIFKDDISSKKFLKKLDFITKSNKDLFILNRVDYKVVDWKNFIKKYFNYNDEFIPFPPQFKFEI